MNILQAICFCQSRFTGSHTESDGLSKYEVLMMTQQQQQLMEVTSSNVQLLHQQQQHLHHHHPQQPAMAGMIGAIFSEPVMLPLPCVDYSWMSGQQVQQVSPQQQVSPSAAYAAAAGTTITPPRTSLVYGPRVIEPMSINTEAGFTTVLVDALAMAGYPLHQMSTAQASHDWQSHHHPRVGGATTWFPS